MKLRFSLKNASTGFTLIELLVVIAIIGILSAVVLASLNTARSRGNDAAITQNLHGVQTQAELYYLGPGSNSYGTNTTGCTTGVFSDPVVAKAIAAAAAASGNTTPACYANTTSYLVGVKLSTNATEWWCIDSRGTAKKEQTVFPTAATYLCP